MSNLETALKGYYPTWSHYLQDVWGHLGRKMEIGIETGDVSNIQPFDASFFVHEAPKLFNVFKSVLAHDLVLAGVWVVHNKAGTIWKQEIYITRKGGIFKKKALPAEELTREIFLIRHLEEIEKWHKSSLL